MEATTILTAVGIGVLVGIVVGALGAGGGILSVPILVYLLGQSPHDAAAESLVIVALTAIVSIIPHARAGRVRVRDGLTFGLLSVIGAVAGSRLSVLVPEDALMVAFGVLLAAVGIVMIGKARRARAGEAPRRADATASPGAVVAAACLTGFLTGFFGVGGGFVVVPMLVLGLAIPMRSAVATSLLVMIITSTVGLASRVGTGIVIDWPLVLAFSIASMIGGLLGAPASRRARESTLTLIFGLLLIAVAAATLVRTFIALL
ncbi:sulfite exporter TauE/SafE family protein [Nanchangia anserum]|uniref:Probable membrane transporter protein n=1 Tax=Nanchangia anserum TaxID=2692125 RepID=A0A8I0KNV3_9ACTO|nr:sulfite exporter TauE/SafE family protein [Nanchangia anserum]MBD3689691.1 sulfite exporter TauE/SafE family protein [Nanchangia anserum]QOX81868.1 sulfite exporter TauE/SafE family protein [Nanchangia anserum]